MIFFLVVGGLWLALYVNRTSQRPLPVTPAIATASDVERWLAARRAQLISDADIRTLRVFESPGYIDSTLHMAIVTQRNIATVLDAQWHFEHGMQCAIAQGRAARATARACREDPALQRERVLALVDAIHDAAAVAVMPVSTTAPASLETPRTALAFKPHEPTRLQDITSQPVLIERLQTMVRALRPPQSLPDRHVLLTGPAGLGKTLFAKILAHELRRYNAAESQPMPRWFELYGSNLVTIEDYDAVFRQVAAETTPVVLLLDEVHCLDERMATKLYKLMEDGLYAFHGDVTPTRLPHVMVLAATTDYGALHPALKRRLGEPFALQSLDATALADVVRRHPFAMDEAAVAAVVSFAQWGGAPWEALALTYEAEQVARASRATTITADHVASVARMLQLDAYGLRPADRKILDALYASPRTKGQPPQVICYALSQADCCTRTQLDPGEFAAVIKPRLQSRGFLVTKSGYGQALTDAALAAYFTRAHS